jgi:tRNA (guanine-N7-)-methyltransferase
MGRRALRKLDPSLDLSPFFFELDDLSPPLDLSAFFACAAPLEIEVGSGKGLFLANAAVEHTDRNFLGIELARKYASFSAARLAKRELENAKVICGDAIRIFGEFLPSQAAAAVHVYFPDPWWKKRHRKRRVLQADFVKDIERVLTRRGKLHFWTDVEEYFQDAVELMRGAAMLTGPHAVVELEAAHDLDYRTHFERRVRLGEQPVYRAEFQKV